MSRIVLLADNKTDQRTSLAQLLRNAGFVVLEAEGPARARELLAAEYIDVAVLDQRLENDSNPRDVSGILLAKESTFQQIPKIIISAFSVKPGDLRSTIGPVAEGLPPAVYFVGKDEGPQALIQTIRQTIDLWPRLKLPIRKVSSQIDWDHAEAREHSRWYFRASFVLSILSCLIIFVGIGLAWTNNMAIGLVGTAGGVLGEVLGILLFKRSDAANRRMDDYHKELLQAYWLETIIATCDQLPAERRAPLVEEAIFTATRAFLNPPSPTNALPPAPKALPRDKEEI